MPVYVRSPKRVYWYTYRGDLFFDGNHILSRSDGLENIMFSYWAVLGFRFQLNFKLYYNTLFYLKLTYFILFYFILFYID